MADQENVGAGGENTVQDGSVVHFEYTLRLDSGEVIDHSIEGEPLSYIHGQGQLLPGLERELTGMAVGESKNVSVEPEDAYGKYDPTAVQAFPRSLFPEGMPLEVGMVLHVPDREGNLYEAYIQEVTDEEVVLNFNHPLAGQRLHFSVRITGVRPATPEELEHGHVHGEDSHHHHDHSTEEGE